MAGRAALVLVVSALAAVPARAAVQAAPAGWQTRAQAQVHLLAIVARSWQWARMPGLVDARSGMLVDNTQAICRGRGRRRLGARFSRFVCVVRPYHHDARQGLYVTYRALPEGRAIVHWLAYRRR